eukprot:109561-Amphidinium_carterae.1
MVTVLSCKTGRGVRWWTGSMRCKVGMGCCVVWVKGKLDETCPPDSLRSWLGLDRQNVYSANKN